KRWRPEHATPAPPRKGGRGETERGRPSAVPRAPSPERRARTAEACDAADVAWPMTLDSWPMAPDGGSMTLDSWTMMLDGWPKTRHPCPMMLDSWSKGLD